jgi:branched-subunit amino acid transport protein AzlD
MPGDEMSPFTVFHVVKRVVAQMIFLFGTTATEQLLGLMSCNCFSKTIFDKYHLMTEHSVHGRVRG